MLQSCETLITKINDRQKAVLELEELSDEFLNSGNEEIKQRIENQKKELEKQSKEYLDLMYQELPNGQILFWPEKELLDELQERIEKTAKIEIKDDHLVKINLNNINLSQFSIDFSLFGNLKEFNASSCQLKKLPPVPTSIKEIWVSENPFSKKEKQRIIEEYPNATIYF